MATGPQVGTAWVQITPSFQGFGSSLLTGMTGDLTGAARRAGDDAGTAGGQAFGSSFSARVDEAAERLSGFGAAAGVAVAGAFSVGLTAAMDATSANTKLAAQLNLTAAEAERAGDVAGTVFSSRFGENIGQVNEALRGVHTNIGDLGSFTDGQLESMATSALGLAETFDQDVSQATIAVGQLMKTGLASDAEQAFDIITAGFQSGADRSGDLLDTVVEYSTQFRNMGLSGEQAMGVISQGMQAGARDADVVADAIKEFSIEAVAGSDKVAGGFEELGLNSDKMFAMIGKGGESAATALDLTLDTLREVEDPVERNAIATELFGTKAEDLGDALYSLDPSKATLEGVAGAAGDMADTLAEDPARVFQSSIRTLTQSLAEGLAPALQTAASWAKDNQGTITALAIALGGIVATVAATSAALRIYQGVMMAIRVATVAWAAVQWVLNAAFWANPITWVIAGIIALIAIIIACIVYWDEIVAAVTAAWDWIVQATQAAWTWLVAAFASMWGGIVSGVQAAWDWIVGIITGAWASVIGAVTGAAARVGAAVTGAWARVRSATSTAWQAVLSVIRTVWASSIGAVTGGASRIWAAITGAWARVRSATSTAFTAVRTAISNALNGALSAVRGIGNRFVSIGRDIVSGIIRGVTGAAGRLFGSLRNMASNALNSAKSALGIGSPSKLFAMEVGQWLPAGIEMGIDRGQGDLDQRVENMVTAPEPPVVRATVATGGAAEPAPVVLRADGSRASQALLELLRHSIRTDLGGDVSRLGTAR